MYTRIKNQYSGFTVLEFMLVALIAGILLTIAAPSFSALLKDNQLITGANDLVTTLQFARAEAMRRGRKIHVNAVDGSQADNELGNGITVWFDSDKDGSLDVGEEINVVGKLQGDLSADSSGNHGTFTFSARGEIDHPDTWHLCDHRTGETGRAIQILATGLVTVATHACE